MIPGDEAGIIRHVRCTECDIEATGTARGWRTYRGEDPDAGEEPLLLHYCPVCAEREFGELPNRNRPEPDG